MAADPNTQPLITHLIELRDRLLRASGGDRKSVV